MTADKPAFLVGPGAMGALIADFRWAETSLGVPEEWPAPLRTCVTLMLAAPAPMALLWGDDLSQIYNDAFARACVPGDPARLLGPARAGSWLDILPEAEVRRVMAGRGAIHREDVRRTPSDAADLAEYWSYSISPIVSERGIDGAVATYVDVTLQHVDAAQSAALSTGLLQLFKAGPDFVAVLQGPEHVYQFVNDHYKALMGDRDFIGRPVREVVPEVAGQGFFELLDGVFRTGKPFNSKAIPMRYRPAPDAPLTDVMLELSYQAIVGADGRVFGIYVDGHPVDSRQLQAETSAGDAALDAQLSERETEVLRWTAAGKTAAEIALILGISVRTVEFHITSAARKLDTVNRVHTVAEAIRMKLIRL